jgi:predicted DNA-binding ribbon-helix-helix protein
MSTIKAPKRLASPPEKRSGDRLARLRAFANRTRTLQFRGKRTSVRLENVFWEYLEEEVRERQTRLGPMIGQLAQEFGGGNLSSYLRAACMLSALAKADDQSNHTRDASAATVLDSFHLTPAPGLLVSQAATVIDANRSLIDWLRRPKEDLLGSDLGALLRMQQGQSFQRFWDTLRESQAPSSTRLALVTVPGRLVAAEVTCVRLGGQRNVNSQYIVWMRTSGGPSGLQQRAPQ